MSESPTDAMLGRLIDGRYQVRSRIARGGMATVYLATDLRLERRVAIKIMHGHLADDNTFKSRFVQEARSAARLAHPNVVNVFDQGQDAGTAYLVMEYLPGITLRDLIKDYGRLTAEQTTDILQAVLSGLAAAHKAGIVHRDLKPENVLLADDGRIKIGDFGLARAANNNTATGQALLGTIAYLSPELVTRGIADARSDIYALGIMTYEMLTGEQPYVGEAPMQIAYQHANDTVPMPSSKVPTVPREFDELVLWATARDPEQRPRDARVMLDQLLDVENLVRPPAPETALQPTMVLDTGFNAADAETQVLGLKPTVTVEAAPSDNGKLLSAKAQKRKRKGYWLVVLVLVLAALAGGTGWYFGAGPGAQVAVPQLASTTLETASGRLTTLGLSVKPGTEYSSTIAQGLVSSTKPGPGMLVAKGSAVTVNVSQGRQPITLPALAGLTEAAAKAAVTGANAELGTEDAIFDANAADGTVLAASRESDGGDVSKGGAYFEGLKVNLALSLGAVPEVSGKTVKNATATLSDKGLAASTGEQSYSDTVPQGNVIKATAAKSPVRAGDTLSLSISRGPEPVAVPNVVGMSWDAGKKALTDLGFKLKYTPGADGFANILKVSSTDPAAGVTAPKGSTITIAGSVQF